MSPEPQDVLTLDVKRKLENVLARHYLKSMTDEPYPPFHGVETFERIAQAHQIALNAAARIILDAQGLPMAGNLAKAIRSATHTTTAAQRQQWALWQRSGQRPHTLSVAAVWCVDPQDAPKVAAANLEAEAALRVIPQIARALNVHCVHFDDPLVGWIIEPDRRYQGLHITIGREDAP